MNNAFIHARSEAPLLIRVDTAGMHHIGIEVADRGPGINLETLDKIFEPFYTTSHEGSGLGLYIVGQLSEHNNATISARRNEFGGTSFVLQVRIPVRPHQAKV